MVSRKGHIVSLDGRSLLRRLDRGVVRSRSASGVPLAQMCFPNKPESVALVRRFVELVTQTHAVAHVGENATLLVSELASNTITHAHTPGARFHVVITRQDTRLRVEVRDSSRKLPVTRHAGVLAESGRGLFLVEQLADDHGTYPLPRGKAVWFELTAWNQAAAQQTVEPTRAL